MHYGGWSVAMDKKQPAIVPFDHDYGSTLGSPFISFIDLLMVNMLYRCNESCDPTTSVKCEMNGFPNPRNCSTCVCPGGYGGDRCTDRPEGKCGDTIEASPNWTTLTNVLGNMRVRHISLDFTMCNYWIQVR
ncbi:hypothetical protein OSTOST_23082 [Ostertagia ostertagi]